MIRVVLCAIVLILFGALLTGCGTTRITEPHDAGPAVPVNIGAVPDAVPRYEPRSRGGNPESYVVLGKRYRVLSDSRGFVQQGTASWYGSKFHGRKTSNGETYDMFAMTAAHKTLPIPTYVRVTNRVNQRSVVVRVNDRGPFHDDRIIDLSYVAAAKLGLHRTGTGRVEVRAIDPANWGGPVRAKAGRSGTRLYLQVGAFRDPDNANRLLMRLGRADLPPAQIQSVPGNGSANALLRVRLGPLGSLKEAARVSRRLKQLGIYTTRLVSEQPEQRSVMIQ